MQEFDFQGAFDRVHDRMNEIHQQGTENSTRLRELLGNGQPGKIQKIEKQLDDIRIWRAQILGYIAAVSGAIGLAGFLAHFAFDYFRK